MSNRTQEQRDRSILLSSCIAGLLGALTLLVGDFLLYANFDLLPVVAPSVETTLAARRSILLATPLQLLASNLLCVVTAVLYVFGAWHLYLRHKLVSDIWAKVAGVLFALVAVMSCIYHALWSQFALIVQHTNRSVASASALFLEASSHMKRTLDTSALVGLPLLIAMIALTANRRSTYPRWTILLNPFLLYAIATPLLTPLANDLPSPYGALILASLSEVTMGVFFVASLLTIQPKSGQRHALDTHVVAQS